MCLIIRQCSLFSDLQIINNIQSQIIGVARWTGVHSHCWRQTVHCPDESQPLGNSTHRSPSLPDTVRNHCHHHHCHHYHHHHPDYPGTKGHCEFIWHKNEYLECLTLPGKEAKEKKRRFSSTESELDSGTDFGDNWRPRWRSSLSLPKAGYILIMMMMIMIHYWQLNRREKTARLINWRIGHGQQWWSQKGFCVRPKNKQRWLREKEREHCVACFCTRW